MRDIPGYEGYYAITSCGQVWSYHSQKFMALHSDKDGYLRVVLHKNGKAKCYGVHRLVALAYIPNPNGLPEINHKDEVKYHNWLDNLEWCDRKYNTIYGKRNKKPVYCVELDRVFESGIDACKELGINGSQLSKVCRGERQTCGGYHWRFA